MTKKNFDTIAGGYLSEHITQRFTERTFNIFNDSNQLVALAEKWQNVASEKAQGHVFEQLEVTKFNLDALKKDSDLFAKTTASIGMPHDKADILIKEGQETLREIQAKSYQTANLSANALSKPEYDSMGKLLPVEQADDARKYLDQKIETNPNSSRIESFKDTKNNLQDKLAHKNVSSTGTTRKEAIDVTDAKIAKKIAERFKIKATLTDMHESGKRAGNFGALITGGMSAVGSIYAFREGEIEVGELISRIAVDSAKGYATGYVVTAMSKGITHSATHFLGDFFSRSLSRSNAPAAIAAGVVNTGKCLVSYINGDIDDEELLQQVSHNAITSTSSFYYGAFGQLAIPIPVVGALVGASIGYFIGNMLHQSGLVALGDSKVVKEAKERRRAIQAMCLTVIPEIQKNRFEMETRLESSFSQRKAEFLKSFDMLDSALYSWNPDDFALGLEKINKQFASSLQFKTFLDFDKFMLKTDEAFEF